MRQQDKVVGIAEGAGSAASGVKVSTVVLELCPELSVEASGHEAKEGGAVWAALAETRLRREGGPTLATNIHDHRRRRV